MNVDLQMLDILSPRQLEAALLLGEGTQARVLTIGQITVLRSTPIVTRNLTAILAEVTANRTYSLRMTPVATGGWIYNMPLQVKYEVVLEDHISDYAVDGELPATLYVEVTAHGIAASF